MKKTIEHMGGTVSVALGTGTGHAVHLRLADADRRGGRCGGSGTGRVAPGRLNANLSARAASTPSAGSGSAARAWRHVRAWPRHTGSRSPLAHVRSGTTRMTSPEGLPDARHAWGTPGATISVAVRGDHPAAPGAPESGGDRAVAGVRQHDRAAVARSNRGASTTCRLFVPPRAARRRADIGRSHRRGAFSTRDPPAWCIHSGARFTVPLGHRRNGMPFWSIRVSLTLPQKGLRSHGRERERRRRTIEQG